MEFIVNQYRHCKTILALGGSTALLERAGISDNALDAGLLRMKVTDRKAAATFIAALAKHRHPERESDPPLV